MASRMCALDPPHTRPRLRSLTLMGYVRASCGEYHAELPFAYHAAAPAVWTPELEDDPDSQLDDELCVIGDEHFFVHAIVQLPVHDAEHDFD
jgi:hypothetical protein